MLERANSMKKFLSLLLLPLLLTSCGDSTNCNITEKRFFLVMTNIQYYPENYVKKILTFDCFTYELTSTTGEKYLCGVRKCSSGFGCKCGKDTIIGFIMDDNIGLPEPINQYENSNEKAWIHVTGQLKSTEKTEITIYGVDNTEEKVQFLSFRVDEFSPIEDYSGLRFYVDK